MTLVDDDKLLTGTDDLEALSVGDVRLEVELLPDGRMRAPDQTTRDMLRDRLRHAELLPTGPSWAVLRTIDPPVESDGGVGREVVTAGVISDNGLSVIDFIGFLASSYQTGVLTASSGAIHRSVYLHSGDVVWASSTDHGDRLGELLVARGKITGEQLDAVMRETGGLRIGQRCVERGYLSAHDLWSMVQAQLKEIFDRLIATESGVWSFARVSEEVLADSQIHLSTQGLLVDALRRLDELNVYRQRVRSAEVLVQRVSLDDDTAVEGLARIDDDIQGPSALLLEHIVAAPATVRRLMRVLGRGEFDVTRIVYQLMRANLVTVVSDDTGPIPRRTPITTQVAKEIIEVYSLALREMFEDVDRMRKGAMLRRTASDFLLDDASSNFNPVYANLELNKDGSIDADRLVAAAAASELDAQDLSDALSEVMFFVLFQATELLGRRRGDNLARRVKMIHGMLANTQSTSS